MDLFNGIVARIHTSRESSLERAELLVVRCLLLTVLSLHSCACRLRRLLLGLGVGFPLSPSTAHCADYSANRSSTTSVTCNRTNCCSAGCASSSTSYPSAFSLTRLICRRFL